MVKYPGTYYIDEGDRLSKLIELAGGIKDNAYTFAGTLLRQSTKDVQESFYNAAIAAGESTHVRYSLWSTSGINTSNMSTFTKYLTESAKSYDYKVKIVGDIDKDFTTRMETALGKFEVSKCSAGKKTPIQSLPLDFPAISNESVTIYDVTTNYPA